jgi:hypothetical protein
LTVLDYLLECFFERLWCLDVSSCVVSTGGVIVAPPAALAGAPALGGGCMLPPGIPAVSLGTATAPPAVPPLPMPVVSRALFGPLRQATRLLAMMSPIQSCFMNILR